eukprot:311822-Chlamydomonas_euryale.AAC.2
MLGDAFRDWVVTVCQFCWMGKRSTLLTGWHAQHVLRPCLDRPSAGDKHLDSEQLQHRTDTGRRLLSGPFLQTGAHGPSPGKLLQSLTPQNVHRPRLYTCFLTKQKAFRRAGSTPTPERLLLQSRPPHADPGQATLYQPLHPAQPGVFSPTPLPHTKQSLFPQTIRDFAACSAPGRQHQPSEISPTPSQNAPVISRQLATTLPPAAPLLSGNPPGTSPHSHTKEPLPP